LIESLPPFSAIRASARSVRPGSGTAAADDGDLRRDVQGRHRRRIAAMTGEFIPVSL